jgi:hypothetical protein
MPFKDPDAKRAYQRAWCRRRREELLDGQPCMRCGATDDLHFHHLDPGEKIDHRFTSWRRSRALAERAKCVVLCRRCHAAYHASLRPKPEHGTDARYGRGCRCNDCRRAHTHACQRRRLARLERSTHAI